MNFNNHITKTLLNEYAGSEKKKTVIMDDGHKYLLKFPDPTREVGRELSYINNALSEHIACSIYNIIGIQAQKTILGEYTDDNGKVKIACACQDIRKTDEKMYEINKLELSSLDNTHARKLSLEYMDEVFEKMDDIIPKEQLSDFYYKMLVVDAFIGNTDRHNGNWAILESQSGIRIAPVYDCGSSLAPLVDEKYVSADAGIQYAMNTSSVLVDAKGKKIKYCEFFKSDLNPRVQQALREVIPNIDLNKIDKLILQEQYLSLKRKEFYTSFLHTTYEKILIPAIEKCMKKPEEKYQDLSRDTCYLFYKEVIQPLRNTATYEKQSLNALGLPNYQYSKAGKGHLFIYKENELVGVLSARSNNRETIENYAKFAEYGLDINKIHTQYIQKEQQKEISDFDSHNFDDYDER